MIRLYEPLPRSPTPTTRYFRPAAVERVRRLLNRANVLVLAALNAPSLAGLRRSIEPFWVLCPRRRHEGLDAHDVNRQKAASVGRLTCQMLQPLRRAGTIGSGAAESKSGAVTGPTRKGMTEYVWLVAILELLGGSIDKVDRRSSSDKM